MEGCNRQFIDGGGIIHILMQIKSQFADFTLGRDAEKSLFPSGTGRPEAYAPPDFPEVPNYFTKYHTPGVAFGLNLHIRLFTGFCVILPGVSKPLVAFIWPRRTVFPVYRPQERKHATPALKNSLGNAGSSDKMVRHAASCFCIDPKNQASRSQNKHHGAEHQNAVGPFPRYDQHPYTAR